MFYAYYPPNNQVTAVIVGPVTVNQGTSPWVISGTVTTLSSDDHNYGTVGANTLRTAAQIGNATGAADFNAGATSAQTLRVSANQGTSPWVVSGTVAATQSGTWTTGRTWTLNNTTDSVASVQSGTWNIGTVTTLTSITNPVTVNQGTSPWVVSGTVTANAGTGTFLVDGSAHIQPVSGTVTVTQGTSPWVVSGTVTTINSDDHNYGTVGANTLRTAAQIGNATGAASFGAGTTTAQTLRVVLPTDQTAIPVTQSGTWSTGRTWTLSSGTDSVNIGNFPASVSVTQGTSPWVVSGTVNAVQSGTWNIGTLTSITNPVTVNQGTSPWVVSGTVTANAGTGNFTVVQTSGANLHVNVDNFPADADALAQGSTTSGQLGNLIMGAVTTAAPSYTTGQTNPLSLTTAGALRTDSSATTQPVSGTVTVLQGTSPWITTSTVSGTVTVSNFPTTVDTNYGTVGANTIRTAAQIGNATGTADFNAGATGAQTLRVTANQGTSPWVVSGTVTANAGTGNFTVVQPTGTNLHTVIDSGTVTVTQGTSPWVISGTVTTTNSDDHNYGTVGANTLRTAAQIGNATGAASFGAGTTTAQTLRVVLPTDQTAIPVTQSGVWSTGRTWTLSSGTDSVSAVQSGTWNIGTLTTITNPVTVNQGTSPWVVSGTVTTTNSDDHNYGTVGANTLRTAAQIGNATGAANFNYGTVGAQTLRSAAQVGNATGAADFNYGTVGAQTLRTAAQIGNATGAADFNAGATGAQTLRVTANQGTSPWVVSGTVTTTGSDDHNYGVVGANTLRSAAQIGNATGAANFNAGATGAQTLRVVANLNDGAGNAITSQANGTQLALDVGVNVAGIQVDPRAASPGTLTDRSGNATNVSSQIMAANTSRKYILIQNSSGVSMWINFGIAAVLAPPSIEIKPNGVFTMEGSFVSTQTVNIIKSAAAATAYTAKEG